jgi:hypothetical protein
MKQAAIQHDDLSTGVPFDAVIELDLRCRIFPRNGMSAFQPISSYIDATNPAFAPRATCNVLVQPSVS